MAKITEIHGANGAVIGFSFDLENPPILMSGTVSRIRDAFEELGFQYVRRAYRDAATIRRIAPGLSEEAVQKWASEVRTEAPVLP